MHLGHRGRRAIAAGVAALVLLGLLVATGIGTEEAEATPPASEVAEGHGTTVSSGAPIRMSFRLPVADGVRYTPNADNVALGAADAGPLLLFLPATGAVPRDYRQFLRTAQGTGYHVLALDYWNLGHSVAQTCGSDAACYGQVQANRFDGGHPSKYSHIAKSDSILARLTIALGLLQHRDPSGGWDRYLVGDRIQWDRVVLAGHSQGGGEAAFIAHSHAVQGVLLFASPVASDGTVVADWFTTPGVTPMSRYYGFDAEGDEFFTRIQTSWAALRLGGSTPATRIGDTVPFGGGHRLVTTIDLGTPEAAHLDLVMDRGPRTAAGAPVFQPVWSSMLKGVRESPTS